MKTLILLINLLTFSVMYRQGNTIYGIIENNTGKNITYNKNTDITESDCDGVLFRKLGTEFFELNVDTITPEMFGARANDLTFDNYDAFRRLINAAKKSKKVTIDFRGSFYRIGRGTGRTDNNGALELFDVSGITINFYNNSKILMDNLNENGNGDQCHGILIKGNSTNITLNNPSVEWRYLPSNRSQGDGIRIRGSVNKANCVSRITMNNVVVRNTPQAGCIVMGAKNVLINNIRLYNTGADGLHFNANHEGVHATNVFVENAHDDALSFITYYHPTLTESSATSPFFSPDYSRNNNGATVKKLIVRGNRANGGIGAGVKIGGGYGISVTDIDIEGCNRGAIYESSKENGSTVVWTELAPINCTIKEGSIRDCYSGVHAESFGATFSDSIDFVNFSSKFSDLNVYNSVLDNIYVSDLQGLKMYNIQSIGQRNRFEQIRECNLSSIYSDNLIFISGRKTVYTLNDNLDDDTIMNPNNITISNVEGKQIIVQDVKGFSCSGYFKSNSSSSNGINLVRLVDANIDVIEVNKPNRDNINGNRGLLFDRCRRVNVGKYILNTDSIPVNTIEIGGGADPSLYNSSSVSDGISILSSRVSTNYGVDSTNIIVQGGVGKPTNYAIADYMYKNSQVSSTTWKRYDFSTLKTFAELSSTGDKLQIDGNISSKGINIPEVTNGRTGRGSLNNGVLTKTVSTATTQSIPEITCISVSGAWTLTIRVVAVCTANTLTITAYKSDGTINTGDTSTYTYNVKN